MAQQNPKKSARKNKQHKLVLSSKDKWKQILKEVEKIEAPVSVIQTISVILKDGSVVDIDVAKLLAEGMDPDALEQEINEKLHDLDDIIKDVNFYINLNHVANTIQPATDKLLQYL